jgi:hypothetical protein
MTSKKPATAKAFDLGGGGSRKKSKPRPFRKVTRRDIERQIARQSGTLDQLKPIRNTPSDVERLAKAAGYGPGITSGLSTRELQQFEADLAFLGILPGRTAGTLPERLVAKYLWGKGLPYEGASYSARPFIGWSFQVPLLGGRAGSGGGAVADILLANRATILGKTAVLRINGYYWHNLPGVPAKDKRQKDSLERAGYAVIDMLDIADILPGTGTIDRILRPILK